MLHEASIELDQETGPCQCARHPGRATHVYRRERDPFWADEAVEDLRIGDVNVIIDGIFFCAHCIDLDDVCNILRRELNRAGIALPLTTIEARLIGERS